MEEKKDQRDQWEKAYRNNEDFFGEEPSELALSVIGTLEEEGAKSILEMGCGQGRDTFFFARKGFDVHALDYSAEGIERIRAKAEEDGLELGLAVHDVRDPLPFPDESFDAVYSHMLLTMELTEEEIGYVLQECLRVLRPGGLNIYSVRNDHDPHYGQFLHVGEDMYQNPMGFVVHFFPEEKVRRLSEGYLLEGIKEFEDTSPPFVKKLYEVVLRKPER